MIRRLEVGDAADYRRIRLEGLLHDPAAFSMIYGEWSKRPLTDFAARLEQVAMFGAFEGGRITATVGLEQDKSDKQTGWIVEVYVTRDHRGRGLSDDLLAHVVAQSPYDKLHLEVAAANAHAHELYTRHGFRETTRDADEQAAKTGSVCEILMLRNAE